MLLLLDGVLLSYWCIVVSISWCHCWRSSARCQAEWMPMLNGWTSLETVLSQVSWGRPLGLLHPVGGLLIAATRTLWWSSSVLLAIVTDELKSTHTHQPGDSRVTRLTSTLVTWWVYGMWRIFLRHHKFLVHFVSKCTSVSSVIKLSKKTFVCVFLWITVYLCLVFVCLKKQYMHRPGFLWYAVSATLSSNSSSLL